MDKKMKQAFWITVSGVVLFAILMNLEAAGTFLEKIISLIMPIIIGGILSIFINVPVTGVERILRKIFRKNKKQMSDKMYHGISYLITVICILLIIALVFIWIIPQITVSIKDLYYKIQQRIPVWAEYLTSHNIDYTWIENLFAEMNVEKMIQNISNGAFNFLGGVVSAVSSTISFTLTAIFSIIVSIYTILGKEHLSRHCKMVVTTYCKPSFANNSIRFCRLFNKSFSKFLTGQCAEALILGMLMFIAFLIFRIPYAALVAVLTAVCAIIPYVGAFISFSVSTLLILLISPATALKCMIVYGVVQFIENQFIYPRVVGSKVGVNPIYVLIAAMIGGKLFGVIGILFFIPLIAVIFTIVKEDVYNKEKIAEILEESAE
ncbi:MAG: AI-2E family transporter [Clostridia bacterium]|nr:AI-2E family transporter [Clostridia bacterium]